MTTILTTVLPIKTGQKRSKPVYHKSKYQSIEKPEAFIFKASGNVCPAGFEPVTFRVGGFMAYRAEMQ